MQLHPRTLIRHALVARLKAFEPLAALCGGRIHANRVSPWSEDELPALGVYMLSEQCLETDIAPPPDERRLTLALEIIARANEGLEDTLDAISLALERALDTLDALGAEMEALGGEDCLLALAFEGSETALAEDGSRLAAVNAVSLTLDYRMPNTLPEHDPALLPDFRVAATGWDLAHSDPRVIDAEDHTEMPGFNEPEGEKP